MWEAEVMHVDFTNAYVLQLNLTDSKVCSSIFRNSEMECGYFEGADFSGADFSGAHMNWTHFQNCDLRGAIMLGQDLKSSYFTGAKFDKTTVWPEGFDPLEYGALLIEDVRPILEKVAEVAD